MRQVSRVGGSEQGRRDQPVARLGGIAIAFSIAAATCVGACSSRGTDSPATQNRPESRVDGRVDGRTGTSASPRLVDAGQSVPKGGGVYKLGSPYKVAGRWYTPQEDPRYDRTGAGSWYGTDFHGRRTANGEVFDMNALTAAHPTLPLPSYAHVTNLANGRTILVRINDRGPYVHNRLIDLSRESARQLGFDRAGTAEVRVRYAGRAPLDGNDRAEQQFLGGQPWRRSFAGSRPAGRMSLTAGVLDGEFGGADR